MQLLEKRLRSGAGDPASTRTHALALKEQLATAAAIGDLAALATRLDTVLAAAEEKAGEAAAAREQARADAVAAKEALVAEAEKIAESATSWKASGDRLRAIVDEWRQIKGVDRKTDDALWKRFAAARDAFGRRRGQHFAQLDAERSTVKDAKERLIARAEELSTSSDWKETTAAMRDLMAEWKAAGRAGRDVEDALWARFRAAQDAFFARRAETFAERDAEQVGNQRRRRRSSRAAEALDVRDPKAAQNAAARPAGAVRRRSGTSRATRCAALDDRMRAAEQRVRDAVDAEWRQEQRRDQPVPRRDARAAGRGRGEARAGPQGRRRRSGSRRPRTRSPSAGRCCRD